MHITINHASQFRDEFHAHGRGDQFSNEALGLLFDYLEEIAPEYELDVVALCCEYSEESAAEIARNYSIDLNDADPETDNYEEQCVAIVMSYLDENTSVIGVTSSNAIIYAIF